MMTKTKLFLAACVGALLLAGAGQKAEAQQIIKLGTLAPVGSTWHELLKDAANQWEAASSGRIKLRVYAGGTLGNEGDMLKKIRVGQLQAAALTTVGLHEITPEPLALDLPLLVQTPEEREMLLKNIGARLEKALLDKGYVALNWSEIGMVRFFSTTARPTFDAMKQGKLFVWDGDPASNDAWKAGGFTTVVLSATDIISSMQTGMINTVAYPPAVAMATRLHDKAKFMTDLVWSSLTGSLVIKKDAWEQVPQDLRPKLMEIARKLGDRTVTEARKMEEESIKKMKSQGLEIVKVTDRPQWQKAVDDSKSAIRGKVVPADLYDEVHRLIKTHRASQKK